MALNEIPEVFANTDLSWKENDTLAGPYLGLEETTVDRRDAVDLNLFNGVTPVFVPRNHNVWFQIETAFAFNECTLFFVFAQSPGEYAGPYERIFCYRIQRDDTGMILSMLARSTFQWGAVRCGWELILRSLSPILTRRNLTNGLPVRVEPPTDEQFQDEAYRRGLKWKPCGE